MASHRLTISLLSLAIALPALANEPVGFISVVEGSVQVQKATAANWQPAAIDNTISLGDAISTGPDSLARIVLVDDTTLTLGEDTEMVIDRMIVGDLATQERSILRQLRGQVKAHVGQAFGGTTRLEIHTPTAVAGVKGSIMELLVGRHTTACNAEGTMFVRNIDERIGGEIVIPIGMCSQVYRGAVPEAPEIYPNDFPALNIGTRTQVATAAIDALVVTGAGVGSAEVAPIESAVDLAVTGPSVVPTQGSTSQVQDTEPTFDGGVESLTNSQLDNIMEAIPEPTVRTTAPPPPVIPLPPPPGDPSP